MKGIRADPLDAALIGAFARADGAYVSGSDLAARFGITRPAIWTRLRKLEADGYGFEAVRNRGYRLIKEPEGLHPAGLLEALVRSGNEAAVWLFEEVDSTNLEADRLLAAGAAGPLVVAARRQIRGRGRLGRVWDSASNENVYLSVGLRPGCPADALAGFTLRVGVFLAEALNAMVGDGGVDKPVKLKWPNDLMLHDRKLGGILTEAKIEADSVRSLVVGVGVNRAVCPEGAPAAALAELKGADELPDHRAVAVAIVDAVRRAGARLTTADPRSMDGEGGQLPERFARLDHLFGKHVTVRRGEQITEGVAAGVTVSGALRLRDDRGNILAIHSGDATLGGYD